MKCGLRQARFAFGPDHGQPIRLFDGLVQLRLQARVVVEVACQTDPLLLDGKAPRVSAQTGLIAPLEQMDQQDDQSIDELSRFSLRPMLSISSMI